MVIVISGGTLHTRAQNFLCLKSDEGRDEEQVFGKEFRIDVMHLFLHRKP